MAAVKSKVNLKLGPFFRTSVDVLTAVDDDDKEVSFRTLCTGVAGSEDHAPHPPAGVKQDLKCPACSNTDKTTFGKGREIAEGVFATVNAEDIATAQVSEDMKINMDLTTHAVEDMEGTVLPGGKTYFLKPRKGDEAIYALFLAMVQASPHLAYVTQWASRSKPAMYRLVPFGSTLTVQQIAWPTSLREAPTVDAPINEAELEQALKLANAAVSPYDPASYKDTRAEQLRAYIAAAEGVEGADVAVAAPVAAKPASGGLAAMLQASLDALTPPAQEKAKKAPAKRAPRKKVAA